MSLPIVLLIFFIIFGISFNVSRYRKLFKKQSNKKTNKAPDEIYDNLSILKNVHPNREKAIAFVSLLSLSYVTIHILINKGNNYNDKKQTESFCASILDKSILEQLYSLEDINGQY